MSTLLWSVKFVAGPDSVVADVVAVVKPAVVMAAVAGMRVIDHLRVSKRSDRLRENLTES